MTNRILIIVLVFLFIIVGCLTAAIIASSHNHTLNTEVQNILNTYQSAIDNASNDDEKAAAYVNRAYYYSQLQTEDDNLCEQIKNDASAAKALKPSESIQTAADTVMQACMPVTQEAVIPNNGGVSDAQ